MPLSLVIFVNPCSSMVLKNIQRVLERVGSAPPFDADLQNATPPSGFIKPPHILTQNLTIYLRNKI